MVVLPPAVVELKKVLLHKFVLFLHFIFYFYFLSNSVSLTFSSSRVYTVDITVYHNGFHGDLNETFFVGEVEEGAKKLVQTTYECLMQAIDSGGHIFFDLFPF